MPPKKRKAKEVLRGKLLPIRVNESEFEILTKKAEAHGLNTSTYLRNLGMNYPVKSIVDIDAILALLKTNGDLGKLGGLFKLWLVRNGDDKDPFSEQRSYKDIDELVDEIEKIMKVLYNNIIELRGNR